MNYDQDIFCPKCCTILKTIEQYPFAFGIVRQCQNKDCLKKFYKSTYGGATILIEAGVWKNKAPFPTSN